MIRNIARNELRNLFYAPLAWFVVILFLAQCAFIFADDLIDRSIQTDMIRTLYPSTLQIIYDATTGVFSGSRRILAQAANTLLLIAPLLTMGIINREINGGSIQLLYSSPVKPFQIVLGKFTGMMLFNSLLILILVLFAGLGYLVIDNFDYGRAFSGILGVFLLLSVVSAVGLFMSSSTNYPIVAALGTFLLLQLLRMLGGFLQEYDILRDITWSFSIHDRLKNMFDGLIRTKDVLAYLNITAVFVVLTILRLQQIRNRRSLLFNLGRSVLVVCIFVTFQFVVSRPQFVNHWDLASGDRNTISEDIQQVVAQLDEAPLVVTVYANLLDHPSVLFPALPAARNIYLEKVWDRYLRFKPDIQFKYEYFYDNDPAFNRGTLGRGRSFSEFPGKNIHEVARELAKLYKLDLSLFKSPDIIRKEVDLEPEGFNTVIKLDYKNRTEFLRISLSGGNDMFMASALKRLVAPNLPFVGIVTGDLQRDAYQLGKREYAKHTMAKSNNSSIFNLGFHVDSINLSSQAIADSVSLLVVADPRRSMSDLGQIKLKNYLQQGRNMLILAEPDKSHTINPLLQELGIEILPGIIVQPRREESPQFVDANLLEGYWVLTNRFLTPALQQNSNSVRSTLLKTAGALKVVDTTFKITPIFRNMNGKSWLDRGELVVDSMPPVFSASEGDQYGDYYMGILLTRTMGEKEQRVALISDADVLANGDPNFNTDIHKGLYSWLHYNEYPVLHRLYSPIDSVNIKPKSAKLLKPLLVIGLPLLVFVIAAVFLGRRSRK